MVMNVTGFNELLLKAAAKAFGTHREGENKSLMTDPRVIN